MAPCGCVFQGHVDHPRARAHRRRARRPLQYARLHLRAAPLVRGFQRPIDSALLGRTLYILEWGGRGTLWALTFPDAPHPR